MRGAWTSIPPSRRISRVWYRSFTEPARKKSIPVMIPWATIPKMAALIPKSVNVAIPSITKPMWATDENAIRRFMSVWAKHPSAPEMMPITASRPIHGAHVSAPSGSIGTAMRTNP